MVAYSPIAAFVHWNSDVVVGADLWKENDDLLRAERDGAQPGVHDAALGGVLRAAALETGAIEGLYETRGMTISIAEQAIEWESNLAELGSDVPGFVEAQLSALTDYALDAATQRAPITEVWIRTVHEVITRPQTTMTVTTPVGKQAVPLLRGAYKQGPNNVRLPDGLVHEYAPVAEVPSEMQRLVGELDGDAFANAHPVVQSAYAHHAFTSIHPFADGNGRVARVLASVYLMRAASIPLVIFSDQRDRYFSALELADLGQPQPLVRFIEDRALDTMSLVRSRLQRSKSQLSPQAARLAALLKTHGGLSHAEVLAAARRLHATVRVSLVERVEGVVTEGLLQDQLHSTLDDASIGDCTYWDRNYRTIASTPSGLKLQLWIQEPVHAQVESTPVVGIANSEEERFTFIVIDANRQIVEPLQLRVDDLFPRTTAAAQEKIDAFAERSVTHAVDDLMRAFKGALQSAGLAGP